MDMMIILMVDDGDDSGGGVDEGADYRGSFDSK